VAKKKKKAKNCGVESGEDRGASHKSFRFPVLEIFYAEGWSPVLRWGKRNGHCFFHAAFFTPFFNKKFQFLFLSEMPRSRSKSRFGARRFPPPIEPPAKRTTPTIAANDCGCAFL
jgi:hypothetical protein